MKIYIPVYRGFLNTEKCLQGGSSKMRNERKACEH